VVEDVFGVVEADEAVLFGCDQHSAAADGGHVGLELEFVNFEVSALFD
jgi:hypothetical protein